MQTLEPPERFAMLGIEPTGGAFEAYAALVRADGAGLHLAATTVSSRVGLREKSTLDFLLRVELMKGLVETS